MIGKLTLNSQYVQNKEGCFCKNTDNGTIKGKQTDIMSRDEQAEQLRNAMGFHWFIRNNKVIYRRK